MDQQKQTTSHDTKAEAEAQPTQPQQQKASIPKDQSIKQANPASSNHAPDEFRGRTQENASEEKQGGFINWDHVESDWKQFRGKIQEKWGKLTEAELNAIEGEKNRLTRKLQEKYGIAKEEVEKRLNEFLRASQETKKSEAAL